MPTLAPERVDLVVERWLEFGAVDDGPAGPLFLGGRYAEYEITMTGGGGAVQSNTATGCLMCTGSFCNGRNIQCA